MQQRILVIRYGGFGDMIVCMAAFRTIRAHHPGAQICVLTTPPYRDLLAGAGYFDKVLIDRRAKPWRLTEWLRLVRVLRGRRFERVYDLQRNERTATLYRVMGRGRAPEWSGVIRGCSHFVPDNPADRRHIHDRLAEQLAVAGIPAMLPTDLGWLGGDVARFGLPPAYVLIVPGGAPHRPEKRAPAECFAGMAQHMLERGLTPVLLGTAAERCQIDAVVARCPGIIDLCDRTEFGDIADLARGATGAVGNDTGAMHLIAAVGCPALVLFSAASDPRKIAPLGRRVDVLACDDLAALKTGRLLAAWQALGCSG
jgi:ADP-heptose:LPS heptosyltransferase